jgi:hypothetical protein
MWRLPGKAPWDPRYIDALAHLLEHLTPEELAAKRAAVPVNPPQFQRGAQIERVSAMIEDVLAEL